MQKDFSFDISKTLNIWRAVSNNFNAFKIYLHSFVEKIIWVIMITNFVAEN